jgi:hypothetical protein
MFDSMPGVVAIANDPADIEVMVRGFHADIERRYAALARAKDVAAKTSGRPPYVAPPPSYLVIDDYFNFMLGVDKGRREELVGILIRIGSIGGEVGCRMWLATQRPDVKSVSAALPGLLKAQLKVRIAQVGNVGIDSMEALMAFDAAEAVEWLYGHIEHIPAEDRVGIGVVRIGDAAVAYKTNWLADPLDYATSDADRAEAWAFLPNRVLIADGEDWTAERGREDAEVVEGSE